MSKKLEITDIAQLYTGKTVLKNTSLYIEGETIVGIHQPPEGFHADDSISAQNQWVLPGLVDLNAEYDEKAAFAGGMTTVCTYKGQFEQNSPLNCYYAYPIVKEERLNPVLTKQSRGTKVLCIPGMTELPNSLLLKAYQYASMANLPIFVQAMDKSLSYQGKAHEGTVSYHLGLKGIPTIAETLEIIKHLEIIRLTKTPIHFSQITSKAGLDLIYHAKSEGLPVTCDVSINHLLLNETALMDYDTYAHVIPPLRDKASQEALCLGLVNGTVDAVCSQHAPRVLIEKFTPFSDSKPGISGIETLLPLLLKLSPKQLSLPENLINAVTSNPANILNQADRIGHLETNKAATLVFFNPELEWVVSSDTLISDGKNSPFMNHKMRGKVTETWVKGQRKYKHSQTLSEI